MIENFIQQLLFLVYSRVSRALIQLWFANYDLTEPCWIHLQSQQCVIARKYSRIETKYQTFSWNLLSTLFNLKCWYTTSTYPTQTQYRRHGFNPTTLRQSKRDARLKFPDASSWTSIIHLWICATLPGLREVPPTFWTIYYYPSSPTTRAQAWPKWLIHA